MSATGTIGTVAPGTLKPAAASSGSRRQPAVDLLALAFAASSAMTAFELLKSLLFPSVSMWQSHAMSIALVGIIAGISGRVVLRGQTKLAEGVRRDFLATLSWSEERLRLALRSSGIAVWSWNIASNVIEADDHSSALFGLPLGSFPRTVEEFAALLHPDDRERVRRNIADTIENGAEYNTEFRVPISGGVRFLASRAKACYGDDERPELLLGVCWDVTERRLAEKALQDADEKLKEELGRSRQHAKKNARLNNLVEILQSCQSTEEAFRIFETSAASVLGCRSGSLCLTSPSRIDVETVAFFGGDSDAARTFRPDACWALRLGKMHKVEDASSPVQCAHVSGVPAGGYVCMPLAAQGETLGILHVENPMDCDSSSADPAAARMETLGADAAVVAERLAQVIANLRLRELLRSQSIRDPLTGLFNRRYLEESFARELKRAEQKNYEVALVMLDLDNFKYFNDTFGHDAGDLILREVGDILLSGKRPSDIACRFGGEELLMMLPETDLCAAVERTESVRYRIRCLALPYKGKSLGTVTVSAGIAMFPANGATVEQLLKTADQALYRAKQQGRDRIVTSEAHALTT